MHSKDMVITIDGPAGSGKTTVAKKVAEKLGYLHIDSGSMYRGLTWKILNKRIPLDDKNKIIATIKTTKIELKRVKDKFRVLIDGKDVTSKIRTSRINENITTIAAIPDIRKYLLKIQRELGKKGGIVMEGRDIGTVVFPHADKKFYLDASIKERARRKFKELLASGRKANPHRLEKSILIRDIKDKKRTVDPLKIPEDADIIDTTLLSINQVVKKILKKILV